MAAQLHSSMADQTLVLSLDDAAHRNALGPEVYASGMEAMALASRSADIGSVVITGTGTVFSAGGNLQRLQANRAQAPVVQAQSIEALHQWIRAIANCPKPVIAAVEGAAAGAGFSLALACDLLVAAEDAVFVMAYSTIGRSWSLAQALPRQLATELLMLGGRIGAPRLHQLGVVNQVAAPGSALDAALVLAQRLNARAPNALASIKTLSRQAAELSLEQQLAQESQHFVANLQHANAGIGIAAFLAKARPKFGA